MRSPNVRFSNKLRERLDGHSARPPLSTIRSALHVALLACVLWAATSASVMADYPTGGDDVEQWLLFKVGQGQPADFNERCGTPPLDPQDASDARWKARCRAVGPGTLRKLLTLQGTGAAPLTLTGAVITGPMDLGSANIPMGLFIMDSRLEGDWDLSFAHFAGPFLLSGSRVRGSLQAPFCRFDQFMLTVNGTTVERDLGLEFAAIGGVLSLSAGRFKGDVDGTGLHVSSNLGLSGANFEKKLVLSRASIAADLNMSGGIFNRLALTGASVGGAVEAAPAATFQDQIDAAGLHVGDYLFLGEGTRVGRGLTLLNASIDKFLWLAGSSFEGEVNANGLHVGGSVFLNDGARFAKDLILVTASIGGTLEMERGTFEGEVNANGLHVAGSVFLSEGARFAKKLTLSTASIGGQLEMEGGTFEGEVDANGLHVAGPAFLRDGARFYRKLILTAATIGGQLEMQRGTFEDQIEADTLHIAGAMILSSGAKFSKRVSLDNTDVGGNFDATGAVFQDSVEASALHVSSHMSLNDGNFMAVKLQNARIGGHLSMERVHFRDEFSGANMHVAGSVFIRDHASFDKGLSLTYASIGHLEMSDSVFAGPVHAEALRVEQDALFDHSRFAEPLSIQLARIGGLLNLSGATLAGLDLSRTTIANDLLFDNETGDQPIVWSRGSGPAYLNLGDAHVGAVQDYGDERPWPGGRVLDLRGFTYEHLGGYRGGGRDMARHSPHWFRRWLAEDPVYSAEPYAQLAGVFAARGDRERANAVLFFGRDRERREVGEHCKVLRRLGLVRRSEVSLVAKPETHYEPFRRCAPSWVGMTVMQATIGYGIGDYTFRALAWALGITLVGTVILLFAPGVRRKYGPRTPRQKSLLWCFGASLSQMLPVIELSPEFKDFFNDPERKRLYAWQQLAFAVIAISGWVLALFVVAAFSGLTQR